MNFRPFPDNGLICAFYYLNSRDYTPENKHVNPVQVEAHH
jgi:hypothetical protein